MIHDITQPIWAGMPVWPGDPAVRLEAVLLREAGDAVNLTRLTLGVHTATHADAPRHLLDQGAGAEALPLTSLVGPCWVADASASDEITMAQLASLVPPDCRRLLLRTLPRSEVGETPLCWGALSAEAAAWLVERGLLLLGSDAPSVDRPEAGAGPVHRALLQAGVVVVEGLALEGIVVGEYDLVCLPLKLCGADGAPARAILIAR